MPQDHFPLAGRVKELRSGRRFWRSRFFLATAIGRSPAARGCWYSAACVGWRPCERRSATRRTTCRRSAGARLRTVKIREEFVYQSEPPPGEPDDRAVPPREHRPPATRLISPRGAALRLFLIALFEAQAGTRAGAQPGNDRPVAATGSRIGWVDLLASDAQPRTGDKYVSALTKKGRQLRNALHRLSEEELVALPRLSEASKKYKGFVLLHEAGRRRAGPNDAYRVPRHDEAVLEVPATLFTRGWIHVLEDGELCVLLMLAYYHGREYGAAFQVPADQRLLHFGIGPDGYEAHKLLAGIGLAAVTSDRHRRSNGTFRYSVRGGPFVVPHTLQFLPGGLDTDAHDQLTVYLRDELNR